MRGIKFRGRTEDGAWVKGGIEEVVFPLNPNSYYIIRFNDWGINSKQEVEEETIGQYTGVKDKNGQEIFEGDIVDYDFHYLSGSNTPHNFQRRRVIEWKKDSCRFTGIHTDIDETITAESRIVGNIYENPELLSN